MQYQTINKDIYRKHLNQVIVIFVLLFAVISISYGAVLIHFFGVSPSELAASTEEQSNFKLNVVGVVLALFTMAVLSNKFKRHDYVKEIYYVWQLKQLHNQVYRKLPKIKEAAQADHRALMILAFYYYTLRQVYQLDNNTLTIATVEKDLHAVKEQLSPTQYQQAVDVLEKHDLNIF